MQRKRVKYGPLAERMKKWARDKHLVDDGHRSIDHPLNIRQSARATIALFQMGLDIDEISGVTGMEYAEVSLVLSNAQESSNPVLIEVMRLGLPRWAASPIPYGKRVRCHQCNHNINHVPCIKCGPDWGAPPETIEEGVAGVAAEPQLDHITTDSLPGSAARIEVYRSRIQRGLAVFHHLDAM